MRLKNRSPQSRPQWLIAGNAAVSLQAGQLARWQGSPRDPRGILKSATATESAGDFLAAMLALMVSYKAYCLLNLGKQVRYSHQFRVASPRIIAATLFILLLHFARALIGEANSLLRVKETERVLRVSAQAFVLILPITFFAAHWFPGGCSP